MSALEAKAQEIGIADYVEKYLHYPPKGPLPYPAQLEQARVGIFYIQEFGEEGEPMLLSILCYSHGTMSAELYGSERHVGKGFPAELLQ